jgi:ATP-binding cassette subfamily C protein
LERDVRGSGTAAGYKAARLAGCALLLAAAGFLGPEVLPAAVLDNAAGKLEPALTSLGTNWPAVQAWWSGISNYFMLTEWPLTHLQSGLILLGLSVACLLLARLLSQGGHSRAEDPSVMRSTPRSQKSASSGGSELRDALRACRSAFLSVGVFSGIINLLMLTGAIFMLEVYDRVLPGRSVPTLVGLAVLAGVLFAVQGILEYIRSRILVRIGSALDEAVSDRVFAATVRLPLILGPKGETQGPLRDLDSVRSFLASNGPSALFDLPWLPFYLLIIYSFHPLLGLLALTGAIILFLLTLAAEVASRAPARAGTSAAHARATFADASRRNAEVVAAMGMGSRLAAAWQITNRDYLDRSRQASDVTGGIGAASRTLRFMLQSAILGLGAWLVIQGEATAGIIIAGSILFGRALAPVDAAIANSKNFVSARQAWARLTKLLEALPARGELLPLPDPKSQVTINSVTVVAPGGQRALVQDVSFSLEAGKALGVIGPSGSGKSCLVRALVGAWAPARGNVQLDGAALDQWSEEAIGRHIGYVPQDVELFSGSVADNIARFDANADPGAIVAAAKAARVHDLITSFPDGYQTQIGDQGAALSAGQRQRVALARALYGDPFLVVLDEPNSNLDAEGERALVQAIEGIKARGGIAIIVAHRPNVLTAVDYIVAMQGGRSSQMLPKAEMMAKLGSEGGALSAAGVPGKLQARTVDPQVAAKLRRALEDGRGSGTTTNPASSDEADEAAGGKPRLRVASAQSAAIQPAPAPAKTEADA